MTHSIVVNVAPVPSGRVTLHPITAISPLTAIVHLQESLLSVRFPEKRADFREIVKDRLHMQYNWEKEVWQRRVEKHLGRRERAIELCHTLLSAGFVVEANTEWVDDIQAGRYVPEPTRWITRVLDAQKHNLLQITWGKDENFGELAKALPGSYTHELYQGVLIVVEDEQPILNFSEEHCFELSDGAIQVLHRVQSVQTCAAKQAMRTREKIAA